MKKRRHGAVSCFIAIFLLTTFVITASVNVGRSRRHQSPLLSATQAVNLVAALVFILALTTAMLAQFGG